MKMNIASAQPGLVVAVGNGWVAISKIFIMSASLDLPNYAKNYMRKIRQQI